MIAGGLLDVATRSVVAAAALPLVPLEPVRSSIAAGVRHALSGSTQVASIPPAFTEPAGDPGLFGPDSVSWRVHSDLPSMLIGGISALLLQSLHPLAMAGVAEHSDYRQDPTGRLQRTGGFLAATTYGSTDAAHEACAVVRRVHEAVTGTAPDGRPYAATDPALVTWVHAAEVGSFLRAHRRYALRPLTARDADRYLAEMAEVAELLGATEVPRSTRELRRYYRTVRPELSGGPQVRDVRDFLVRPPTRRADVRAVYGLVVQASIGLLPGWGRELLELRRPPVVGRFLDPVAVRPAALALSEVLRWAVGPSPLVRAATERSQAGGREAVADR